MRNIDLFDAYLSGSLTENEKNDFEFRLNNEKEFRNDFELHKLFVDKIAAVAAKDELKKLMNEAHESIFGRPNIYPIASGISYLRVAAVAAGISIVVFLSGIFIYRFSARQKTSNPYQELVNKAVQQMQDVRRGLEKMNKKEMAPATMEASGFFISSKGYFMTSLHSVKNADSVMVQNEKLDYVSAEKVWEDPQLDVAVFKLSSVEGLQMSEFPITFRKDPLELGEKVFAIGYPRETIVYTEGNISAGSGLNGDTTKYQLSLLINPGSSGSPVLDEAGNLVGIISGRNISAQGVSYAVKSKYIQELIDRIPDEKLKKEIKLDGKNSVKKLRRTDQLKKLSPFVFSIKVYKSLTEE